MIYLGGATPRARKRHRCDLCFGLIEPGEVYDRSAHIGDDGPYAFKACIPCREVASGVIRDDYYDPDCGYDSTDAGGWAEEVACAGDPVAVAYLERRAAAWARERLTPEDVTR